LHNIIDNHTTYPYTASTNDVWDILKESDRDPSNPENVILIYTGWSVNAAQEYNDGAGWSLSMFGQNHMVILTKYHLQETDLSSFKTEDISVNSARGEKDFDNGGTQHPEATMCLPMQIRGNPAAVKGDVARMMFYMATRYQGDVAGEPDLELV
jgi:endonuclease I